LPYGVVHFCDYTYQPVLAGEIIWKPEALMENEKFNMSLRRYLKHVGVTSQQEVERVVHERHLKGKLKLKMVLTAEGTDLKHVVEDDIELG
jgi:hypothetical protein